MHNIHSGTHKACLTFVLLPPPPQKKNPPADKTITLMLVSNGHTSASWITCGQQISNVHLK
jgi:hypothetical protein